MIYLYNIFRYLICVRAVDGNIWVPFFDNYFLKIDFQPMFYKKELQFQFVHLYFGKNQTKTAKCYPKTNVQAFTKIRENDLFWACALCNQDLQK